MLSFAHVSFFLTHWIIKLFFFIASDVDDGQTMDIDKIHISSLYKSINFINCICKYEFKNIYFDCMLGAPRNGRGSGAPRKPPPCTPPVTPLVATQAVSKRKESSHDQLETFFFSSFNCLYLNLNSIRIYYIRINMNKNGTNNNKKFH